MGKDFDRGTVNEDAQTQPPFLHRHWRTMQADKELLVTCHIVNIGHTNTKTAIDGIPGFNRRFDIKQQPGCIQRVQTVMGEDTQGFEFTYRPFMETTTANG